MKDMVVPRSSFEGFSLIEIVLALAVVSFAIVGIMGLFPVAMKSAQESQRETRAAQIARQIFDEIQSLPPSNTALIRGPSITNVAYRITGINIANGSTNILGYNEQGNGLSNSITPTEFLNPISVPDIFFVAKVAIVPQAPPSKLSRLQVDVEAPATATSSNRSRYTFVTQLDQR